MPQDFFQVLSVQEVTDRLMRCPPLGAETLPLDAPSGLEGRVLARDVSARDDVPLTSRSGMDGYAVRAADTFGATEANPAYLDCVGHSRIDQPPACALHAGQCAGIVTGGTLPPGADAIVMVEHTHDMGSGTIEIRRAVPPGEYVMLQGEDARAGACALPAGTPLRPQEVGLLAAVGATRVEVCRQPVVAIISTGDEVIPVHESPRPGQVRDVNSHALAALARRAGGVPLCLGIVPDELDALEQTLQQALTHADVVLLSGGSSVGVRDLTVAALRRLPQTDIFCHGVAISPGKPLILAHVGARMVWGLPGQVTSAQVVMMVLGQPFLRRLAGHAHPFDQNLWPQCTAMLARNIASRQGREDYVRVRLEPHPDGQGLPLAVPVPGMSGLLRTLTGAQGVVRIPERLEGLEQGISVRVLLFDGAR